ncbi:MAG TPA: TetR/AcrR family transcriptional regulator [Frankiaceae bacterium]|nr:TetR/AcrR family transcriptional regulator [Frankiaceae bacterium]
MSSSPLVPTNRAQNHNRRDAIIDVAAERFAQQGFHGVSMRDIARANGSSVAALYNHFASKDDLLLAVGERFFGSFIERLESVANRPGDGLTRFLSMLRVAFTDANRHGNEYLSISRDNRHIALTPELAPLIQSRNACVALWDRVLHEGMQDGSIQADLDPPAVIWIVFSTVTGMVDVTRAKSFAGIFREDPLQCIADLLRDGLRPRT